MKRRWVPTSVCRAKPQGGGIPEIMLLGEEVVADAFPYFENVCHPWGLPIAKHEVNIIRNLNIHKVQGIGGAGLLHLLLESETDLTPYK